MMKLFFFLVIICVVSSTQPNWMECGRSKYKDAGNLELPAPSIVGGIPARRHEFPWQVVMKTRGRLSCGGTILNNKWIMSAAHCTEYISPSSITIVAGKHMRENEAQDRTYTIDKIINHPSYKYPTTYSNDFALLKVKGTIGFNENIWPACAPDSKSLYTHTKSLVSGWGAIRFMGPSSNELLYTTLNITTNEFCKKMYGKSQISPDMICATDNMGSQVRDSCQGDSGGPLVTQEKDGRFTLIGVVSWGRGCASDYPGVYSRVAHVSDWILKTIQNK